MTDGVVVPDRAPVRHYYHIYADGKAALVDRIVRDHFAALRGSGVAYDEIVIGVVGLRRNRERIRHLLPSPDDQRMRMYAWDDGYEQRTLQILQHDLQDWQGRVMYAHTKGAAYPLNHSTAWRDCMTKRVVREARIALKHLDAGADTVGPHWLTPREFPHVITSPFYGGNFWWATTEHLSKLRPINGDDLRDEHRFDAEQWIGSVVPRNPVNLVSGWPGTPCFRH